MRKIAWCTPGNITWNIRFQFMNQFGSTSVNLIVLKLNADTNCTFTILGIAKRDVRLWKN